MAAPRKDDVKTLIIETTEKMLETRPISAISLAEIARESGISKGTLYYHYKSKDEIIFDITDQYLSKQWDELVAWTSNPQKDTSLHRLVMYVVERNISTATRIPLYLDAMNGNEEIRQKLLNRYSEFERLIAEKISERTDAVSPDYFAWLILLASDGLFIQKTLGGDILDVENFIAQSVEYIKKIIPQ